METVKIRAIVFEHPEPQILENFVGTVRQLITLKVEEIV